MLRTILSVLCALAIASPVFAHATAISLNFSSLPSSQGWTYFSQPVVLEASVFSLTGSTMRMDSNSVNTAYYYLDGILDPLLPYTVETTARVVSGGTALSFYVGGAFFYLNPSGIVVLDNGNWSFISTGSNTDFHDYVLSGVGNVFSVARDGVLIYSGIGGTADRIILGDGGGLGAGVAEVTAYSFVQGATVSEPSTALLVIIAGLGLLFRRQLAR